MLLAASPFDKLRANGFQPVLPSLAVQGERVSAGPSFPCRSARTGFSQSFRPLPFRANGFQPVLPSLAVQGERVSASPSVPRRSGRTGGKAAQNSVRPELVEGPAESNWHTAPRWVVSQVIRGRRKGDRPHCRAAARRVLALHGACPRPPCNQSETRPRGGVASRSGWAAARNRQALRGAGNGHAPRAPPPPQPHACGTGVAAVGSLQPIGSRTTTGICRLPAFFWYSS